MSDISEKSHRALIDLIAEMPIDELRRCLVRAVQRADDAEIALARLQIGNGEFNPADVYGVGHDHGLGPVKAIRCHDERSAKRMLAYASRLGCRICNTPVVYFIAVPNEFGFNVLAGYCEIHGNSMLRPLTTPVDE